MRPEDKAQVALGDVRAVHRGEQKLAQAGRGAFVQRAETECDESAVLALEGDDIGDGGD